MLPSVVVAVQLEAVPLRGLFRGLLTSSDRVLNSSVYT
jgi:hypothetical protein